MLLFSVEEDGEEEKWAQQEHEQVELERQPQRQLRMGARLVPKYEMIGAGRECRRQASELELKVRGMEEDT